MSQPFTIHRLTPEDQQSAFQVFEEAIPDAFEQQGIGDDQSSIAGEIEGKKQLVRRSLDPDEDRVTFLVAKRGGEVVGTISFGPCGHETQVCTNHELDEVGELGSLYVRPSAQNQGIGSALIGELIALLKARGVERFCLDSGYWAAQKRWRRKFGEPYKIVEGFWGPGSPHMIWLCEVKDF
ncbi:GNAT family N-acetyltransferase [Gorillibacterium timonense]|uniref:GNAT family N-acetyltransferase n=1 Tax=Gorillibacterium timonense TaxID=1689269 RepID=UPI00071CCD02|nr:GNAT family N-acetyltransferase [Gorillibacterium timonense]